MEVVNPVKLDDNVVKKLEDAFKLGCSVGEACFSADISRQTYYNWIESFPGMKERFDSLKENPIFLARKSVVDGLQANPELALKFLERKLRNEFSLKTENETNGSIEIKIAKEISDKNDITQNTISNS
jgi:hypothetical protein